MPVVSLTTRNGAINSYYDAPDDIISLLYTKAWPLAIFQWYVCRCNVWQDTTTVLPLWW